ncbi:hypothetical protein GOA99_19870 [Sinorhizobium meliloti]|nr:hypothetical protein [Sinorhizobium meliloti]MDW9386892.1 hypothetical protein [Sinorhizobium meliloti]
MAKRTAKSETLTIRLDPKTRFMLEFVARLRGQTITTVVERAIADTADEAKIVVYDGPDLTWKDFWSIEEGERALQIYAEPSLRPTYEEDKRLAFARKHWPFFYTSDKKQVVRTGYVEILWPRIDEFIAIDDEHKANDYFAAGRAMKKALSDAKVASPDWPPETKPSSQKSAFSSDLDDDIPF